MKSKKDNNRYQFDTTINYKLYKKMRKVFLWRVNKPYIIYEIILLLLFILTIQPPDPFPIIDALEAVMFLSICGFILYMFIILVFSKLLYKGWLKKNNGYNDYIINFYDNDFEKISGLNKTKFLYNSIKNIKVKKNYMLIKLDNKKELFLDITNKLDVVTFLEKKRLEKHEKHIENNDYVINNKKNLIKANNYNENNNGINISLNVLFILSICSIWLSLFTIVHILAKDDTSGINMFLNSWGAFIFLPIPVVSTILGFKYSNMGYKCNKNIIAGIIVSFVLLITGSISMFFVGNSIDYNEAIKFEPIVDVKLPSSGKYYKTVWDESYLENHITNTIKFSNKDESTEFFKLLKANENWFSEDKLDISFFTYFSPTVRCLDENNKCYYSLYNVDSKDYNIFPEKSGKYHFYSMSYNSRTYTLVIDDYYTTINIDK